VGKELNLQKKQGVTPAKTVTRSCARDWTFQPLQRYMVWQLTQTVQRKATAGGTDLLGADGGKKIDRSGQVAAMSKKYIRLSKGVGGSLSYIPRGKMIGGNYPFKKIRREQ